VRKTRIAFPALTGVLAAGLVTGPALAQTVKVGIINTYSGPAAAQGTMLEMGLKLYYKLHQTDLPPGVKIELIERDDTGLKPEVAKRLAQELVTRDHVQIITGLVWSPNAVAVAPVATEAKLPVAAWYKEYGNKFPPDFESADAWDGMKAIFQLVEHTKGKFTGDEAMAFLKNWKDPNSPKGPVMIDPQSRNVIQNVYMRKVEKQNGKLVDIEFETIPMVNADGNPTGLPAPH
jgi:ABC-type branched-subunit amino acid transport system substrate-binding protein